MVNDDRFDDTVSHVFLGSKCPIRQMDDAQPGNGQQRRDENRRGHLTRCLDVKMRSERGAVCSFTFGPPPACLVSLLARGSVDYGAEQRVVHFERPGEVVLNMQGDHPGQQDCAERFMTVR
jgi:hypothetical protein